MGFLAVLGAAPSEDWTIDVCRLHVNLWCMRRRFAGHALILDVGIGFRQVSEVAPSALEILIPVGPDPKDKHGVRDLVPQVREQPAAQLVFGEPVSVESKGGLTCIRVPTTGGHTVQYDYPLVLTEIATPEVEVVEAGDLWRVRLPFQAPLMKVLPSTSPSSSTPPQPSAAVELVEHYVRFRVDIDARGSVWVWKKHGPLLPKTGALVDLRVADLRDPVTASGGKIDEGRVLPARWVNIFVVAPQWLQHKVATDLRSIRLLEGAIWQPYLNRKLNSRRRGKSVVCYRRLENVSRVDPAKTFLDLGRETGLGWSDYLRIMVLAGGTMALVAHGPDWLNWLQAKDPSVKGLWTAIWAGLDAIGKIIGVVGTVGLVVGLVLGAPRRVTRRLRRFERDRLAKP